MGENNQRPRLRVSESNESLISNCRAGAGSAKPILCIIAGPNGSGKTSTTELLLQNEWTADSLYINPDNIAQQQFGDWNSPEAVLQAAKESTRLRYECVEQCRNFVFETVFSSDEKLDFVRKAKAAGFFVRFFFVCTASPDINIRRIFARYLEGGHEVPMSKVYSRYYKSLANAAQIVKEVDRAYVYDNSIDDDTPRLLFRTVDGKVFKQYKDDIPEWAQMLMPEDS